MNAISSFAPPSVGRILLPFSLAALCFAAHPASAQSGSLTITGFNYNPDPNPDVIQFEVVTKDPKGSADKDEEIENVTLVEKTFDINGNQLSQSSTPIYNHRNTAPGQSDTTVTCRPNRTLPANAESLTVYYEVSAALVVSSGSGSPQVYQTPPDGVGYEIRRVSNPTVD